MSFDADNPNLSSPQTADLEVPGVDISDLDFATAFTEQTADPDKDSSDTSLDLDAYIKAQQEQAQHVLTVKKPIDLPEGVRAQLAEAFKEDQPKKVALPDVSPVGPTKSEVRVNDGVLVYKGTADKPDVHVTEEEQKAYIRHLLHDEPLRLQIKLPNDFSCEIRALTGVEERFIDKLAHDDAKEYFDALLPGSPINLFYQHRLYLLQRYSAAAQVLSIRGATIPTFHLARAPKSPKQFKKAAKKLQRCYNDGVNSWSSLRFSAVFAALQMFSAKVHACREGSLNGNF